MRLIVNADDFGYTPGVTAGILRAHREGIVTATTMMANAPDTDGAARAAPAASDLDVGVHLLGTYRVPLTPPAPIPPLVEGGRFPRGTDPLRARRPNAGEGPAE